MEKARCHVNDSSWGRERQSIVIWLYCFHSNVLREEHRSAADCIVNHKLCFAVLTLFVTAFSSKVAFPALTVLCTQSASPVLHARTLMHSREEADSLGCYHMKIRV